MAITSLGTGSGLDLESLVNDLVNAEIAPQSFQLDQQEVALQTELSAVGTLRATLDNLALVLEDFTDPNAFLERTSSSSNDELFTVSADQSAVASSYTVEVTQLAQAQRLQSAAYADEDAEVGTGTLTIQVGPTPGPDELDEEGNPLEPSTFDITLAADAEGAAPSLADLRDAINDANDNPGVTASIVNGDDGAFLILSSDETGLDNRLTITASADSVGLDALTFDPDDVAGSSLSEETEALDSIVVIDNITVTSSSNTVTSAIDGVTINLESAEVGTEATLRVSINEAAVQARVDTFIFNFNSVIDTINSLTVFDADSGLSGPLIGDSTVRTLQSQFSNVLGGAVSGLEGTFDTLSDIGITLDATTGRLVKDQTIADFEGIDTVAEAIDADLAGLAELFASENGIANQLAAIVESYVESDGALPTRVAGLEASIEDIGDEREDLEARAVAFEAQLRSEFIALDLLVAELSSTSAFLSEQLALLPTPGQG
ncbi:MAG: flagellar filament capping protein FliD [Pseudomonadota bacterium]